MTQEFIQYRIEKAEEVYQAACILYEAGQWNSAVNRLYYACFYVASALLLQQKIGAKSHAGVIAKFSENVVRTGKMDAGTYKVYSKLLNSTAPCSSFVQTNNAPPSPHYTLSPTAKSSVGEIYFWPIQNKFVFLQRRFRAAEAPRERGCPVDIRGDKAGGIMANPLCHREWRHIEKTL